MSRIVFAHYLRKTINVQNSANAPLYTRPRIWIPLSLLNIAIVTAIAMSWKMDSLWVVLPQAKAYAITSTLQGRLPQPSITLPAVTLPAVSEPAPAALSIATPELRTPLDPKAQKASEYIATTYHIAREASELISREAFKAGRENSVDPLLILAIIGVESRFNPISGSQVGALGLTQTMPESHPEKVASIQRDQGNILNIADNIQLGAKVISEYMRKFGNNPVLALQQYNGSLKDKSRAYSSRVLELRAKFSHAVT